MSEIKVKNDTKNKELTIMIKDIEYKCSISQLKDKEGIIIKLNELKPKTNIYYLYQAEKAKLTTDNKILSMCQDIKEVITTLEDIFEEGKVKFEEKEDKYFLEMKISFGNKEKTIKFELNKYEPKDKLTELNEKMQILENKYNNLIEEIKELKIEKENKNEIRIKDKVKEILEEKEIKIKLKEIFEQMFDEKFKIKEKDLKIIENKNENKRVMEEFNEKINSIKEEYNQKMEELNNLKNKLQNLENDIAKKKIMNKFKIILKKFQVILIHMDSKIIIIILYLN